MDIQSRLDAEQKQETRRSRFVRYGAVAAAALLIAGGAIGAIAALGKTAPAAGNADAAGQVLLAEPADDYATLYKLVSESGGRGGMTLASGASADVTTEAVAEEPMPAPDAETDSAAWDTGSYSETNVQVAGVDEADVVKTDGNYIYYVAGGALYIVRADGENTKLVSRTALSGDEWYAAGELFLLGDRLMIVSQSYSLVWIERGTDGYESGRDSTRAVIFDVSDRAKPKQLVALGQSGSYVSSRLVGDYVYLITTQYVYDAVESVPVTYVPSTSVDGAETALPASDVLVYSNPTESAYTVIGAIDLKNGTSHAAAKAVFGGTGELYCSGAHLLLAQSDDTQQVSDIHPDANGKNVQVTSSSSSTKLVLFSLDGAKIEKLAQGVVPGTLLNQFAMDEYEGVFRVVTTVNSWEERIYTDGVDTYEYDSESYNCLYTLDSALNVLGKIENLAKDEWVESVRFDGEIGYFVTFRQTDPLFAVDLSDPAHPKVLSSLKIPGFSEYLHVYGDGLLLGLGYAADENTGARQGVKLSMFDVSDKANVKELTTERIDADWTAVGNNHKAILVSAARSLIAFPADNAYYIYTFSNEGGFALLKKVGVSYDLWSGNLRGLFIGESFYVISETGVSVFSMESWERTAQIAF